MADQLPVSATPTTGLIVERRSAGFHPSIWGDYFLQYASKSKMLCTEEEKKIDDLQKEVKRMLVGASNSCVNKPLGLLNLIDQIQRLGIGYRFERDIDEALMKVHSSYFEGDKVAAIGDDLHTTALMFRLLRQHGFNISCNVFNKFKDNTGSFCESLATDVTGLLSLYEASHCRVHGEDILEEALAFSVTHLRSILDKKSPFANEVYHALKQCIHKGLTRPEARFYIKIYSDHTFHDELLLKLAKLDFNLLQRQHQKELADITRWWKDLEFGKKLPFARDRITECYFWILGVYFEPQYQLARKIVTKVIALTSVMDDIYDVYGTLEELQLLTSAIERWDIGLLATKELPEYMQVFYKGLIDVYAEIEKDLIDNGRSYRLFYAKEAMKNQARGYLHEAKWFHNKYVPTVEEYMTVATVTSAYELLATLSFVGIMEDVVTKDVFEWLFSSPKILRASCVVNRLMDDIVSHKLEQERGHVASAVECYMKQHNVSEEEAEKELRNRVDDAWKDINEDCLYPTAVPTCLLQRILNLTRVMDVLYKDKDRYTHADGELKDFVTSLLVDPIPI